MSRIGKSMFFLALFTSILATLAGMCRRPSWLEVLSSKPAKMTLAKVVGETRKGNWRFSFASRARVVRVFQCGRVVLLENGFASQIVAAFSDEGWPSEHPYVPQLGSVIDFEAIVLRPVKAGGVAGLEVEEVRSVAGIPFAVVLRYSAGSRTK